MSIRSLWNIFSSSTILWVRCIYRKVCWTNVARGMVFEKKNHDIFLVTINKESSHFGESIAYEDYAINDELFHWQTQNSVADGSDTLNRYINSNGRISLFVRINRKENGQASPYIYLGEAEYVSHSGSRPVGIVWKLKHKIPAKYLDKMMKT